MKNYLKLLLSFTLVFALIGTAFTQVTKAQEISNQEANEVAELAGKLEYIFEEATLKDGNGQIISIDINKIEEKYGSMPELELLKEEIERVKDIEKSGSIGVLNSSNPEANKCLKDKLAKNYGDLLSVATYTTILTWIWEGEYTLAAKKLLSVGIRGNAMGIAATLLWFMTTCINEHPRN